MKSRSASDLLYIILAFTDILTGTIVKTTFSYELYYLSTTSQIHCSVWAFVNVTGYIFSTISISVIAVISTELYISVNHSFFYERSITKNRLCFILFCLGTFLVVTPIVNRILRIDYFDTYRDIMAIACIPIVIVMSLMHLRTYFAINKMISRVRGQDFNEALMLNSKKKLLKMAALILFTFVCCFMPVAVTSLYILQVGHRTVEIQSNVVPVVEIIALTNSFLDPFVYYFRLGKVRRNMKKLLFCSNSISENRFDQTTYYPTPTIDRKMENGSNLTMHQQCNGKIATVNGTNLK